MRRLFGPASASVGDTVSLDPEAKKHAKVLRLEVGARVELFDGEGHLAEAELVAGGRARIHRAWTAEPVAASRTLIWGLPKAPAVDTGVRMATELGVDRIVLALAERTPRPPSASKLERWRRIALEATRQCERATCPILEGPLLLAEAAAVDADVRLVALARGERTVSIGEGSVAVAIGPEGGFTDAEQALLLDEHGFHPLRLGHHVLRSETAVAAALARLAGASLDPGLG